MTQKVRNLPHRKPVDTPTEVAEQSTQQTTSPPADRRESVVDRRNGLERRRGPGRRRPESRRTAEEGELDSEQFEFVLAMDEYKRANNRPFPSWTEVLEVIKYLGYRKSAGRGEHLDQLADASDKE